jgi:NtrC-family two-component system sensor histidine kinase KinB
MSTYLLPLLIFALLIGTGWALRRRSPSVLWRGREYRTVLDSLEDAILVYDEAGRPIYLNRAARDWFGLEEADSYETQPLRTQVTPVDEFFKLLSREGRASLRVGSRYVEAVSQRVTAHGVAQITLVLHDVTASRALLAEERRRVRELAVFNEINQAINASLNLDNLLETILTQLRQLVPYHSATVRLWNPATGQLAVKGRVGLAARSGASQSVTDDFADRIVRQREAVLIRDTSDHAGVSGDPVVRSYVGVPLFTGTQFVGILELSSDQAGTFSPENLNTLNVIASHAAVAIENARLYSETLLRAEELATMNTLSSAINASLNLDELLDIVVYSISQAAGCDKAAIFLMDNERRLLSLAKSRGLSETFIRRNQNIRPTLGGQAQVVLDRYPLVVNDISQIDPPADYLPLLLAEGIHAFADLPLRGRERVLGALTLYYGEPHAFDETELELLRTFANQVTLALENARLYERTDRALARRVDQLAAIEEIGRELTSTLDLTGVFNLVLKRAAGSTGASAGILAVRDADSNELEVIVAEGYPPDALERYRAHGWPMELGIVGQVARTGETALVNDVEAEPLYIPHIKETSAQLVIPIVKENRVLGVISLESSRHQGFSPDDVRFTTQLAELAAIAIDNARLFEQVREGRDNLQAILDSTREGVLVIGRDNRIVLANPMIEQLSGVTALELVGRRARDLIEQPDPRVATLLGYPTHELERASNLLDVMSDHVTKRTYELPGNRLRHIEQVGSPVINRGGEVVGRLIVLRDVTEERRLAAMRQDLTDMIIHDLRSPLTAVVGGVQVASDLTAASAESSSIQHALEMANQSCERLMSLVDSLLDISRLEAGQMPLERQPVLLDRLAQSVIEQTRPLAEQEKVTLQLQTVSQVPPVDADYELIGRVLVNLLDNAIKHSPRNGLVNIKITSRSSVAPWSDQGIAQPSSNTEELPQDMVLCAVLDMGPGIPSEHRERVFERFAQLDGRRRGKGLGLAFCRLALQAHGGRIWVEDNPRGKGSAFIFTLPAVPAELLRATEPEIAQQLNR